MKKPFVRIENLDEFSQLQVYTGPDGGVSIVGYTLNPNGDVESHASIALSPNSTLVLLNMLRGWAEYAIEA